MEEKILISGLIKKDRTVFDYIFNLYYSGLCTYSLKYVPDMEIVEDIVQDFFVSLWVKAGQLNITTSLQSYLFTSVKNRCLNYLKHHKVTEKFTLQFIGSAWDSEASNYNMFIESELREALDAALEKLPPRCREIFELSRYKGLKNQEIAEKLGLSKRTVELQISLALKTLKVELKDFLPAWLLIYLLH